MFRLLQNAIEKVSIFQVFIWGIGKRFTDKMTANVYLPQIREFILHLRDAAPLYPNEIPKNFLHYEPTRSSSWIKSQFCKVIYMSAIRLEFITSYLLIFSVSSWFHWNQSNFFTIKFDHKWSFYYKSCNFIRDC